MSHRKGSYYYQLDNITPGVRKAVKTAAALKGMTMKEWMVYAIKQQAQRQDIIIEEEANE